MKLGYNVSYVRHISSDWDPYLFSFLERGGNSRFISLSKKYELDCQLNKNLIQEY